MLIIMVIRCYLKPKTTHMKILSLRKIGSALLIAGLISIADAGFGQNAPPADPSASSPDATEAAQPPPAGFGSGDVSPTENTDVSTLITTGCGYDAWTGAVRRQVTDLSVPGAVSSHGLSVVRTYTSSTGIGWSLSWQWQIHGQPFTGPQSYLVNFPDGRATTFYPPDTAKYPGETAYRAGRGTKERLFLNNRGSSNQSADLYLEDGSHVHFTWTTEPPDPPRRYSIDTFYSESFTDPYGQITMLLNISYPPNFDNQHLAKVIDPSGRSLTYNYDPVYPGRLASITASTGQTVTYDGSFGSTPTVTYSDETSATYTYGETTYLNSECPQGVCHPYKLMTATDVRAEGPMRSIRYTYYDEAPFQGQVKQEQHPSGLEVSKFLPTNGRGSMSATNLENRGDGPQRSFYIAKDGNTPLLRRKSDFKGVVEIYDYDGTNYLKSLTDRNGNVTTFMNEPILGRPLKVTHTGGSFTTGVSFPETTRVYTYTDPANPYYVASVKDDRSYVTTYQRDPATHRITTIDYPRRGNRNLCL